MRCRVCGDEVRRDDDGRTYHASHEYGDDAMDTDHVAVLDLEDLADTT